MAISRYPTSIIKFPHHRNLLDDVDAAHINSIQAELETLLSTMGTNPHIYNDINLPQIPTESVPVDDGGVVDDETQFAPYLRYYDPEIKPVNHGSVGQRLDDIERGKQNHAFKMGANNVNLTSSVTNLSTKPRLIRCAKPGVSNDPFTYFDGAGATLRKGGFWVFHANVVFTLLGTTAGANNGSYQAALDIGGAWIEGIARDQESGSDKYPSLNPTVAGFYPRGTRVLLRASQNSGRTQRIRYARLTGWLVREQI